MTANCLALVELNSELGSCLPYLQLFGVDDCYQFVELVQSKVYYVPIEVNKNIANSLALRHLSLPLNNQFHTKNLHIRKIFRQIFYVATNVQAEDSLVVRCHPKWDVRF